MKLKAWVVITDMFGLKPLGKWYVLKNKGGDSMAKQIEDVLGDSGMYMVDESKKRKR